VRSTGDALYFSTLFLSLSRQLYRWENADAKMDQTDGFGMGGRRVYVDGRLW
jgi:hypothetical protein